MTLIISTKSELKNALKNKTSHFTVTGKLAKDIKKSKKITKLGKLSLAILTASIAAIILSPATGGTSGAVGTAGIATVGVFNFIAPAAVATTTGTGISTSVIFAVIALGGVTIVLALFKDYDVKYAMGPSGLTAEFTRKK